MNASNQNACEVLSIKEGKVPFVMRFVKKAELDPGTKIVPNNGDPAVMYDEKKWTHYDESSGIFSSESDTTSDG